MNATETYRLQLLSADGVHRVLSLCRRRRYEVVGLTYNGDKGLLELAIACRRCREELPGVSSALLPGLAGLIDVTAVERVGTPLVQEDRDNNPSSSFSQ